MSDKKDKKQQQEQKNIHTDEAGYYLIEGQRSLKHQKLNKALQYFKEAIKIDPKNTYIHYNVAYSLKNISFLKDKNKAFKEIIGESEHSSAESYFLAGVYYALCNELEKAEIYLKTFLETNPCGDIYLETKEFLQYVSGEEKPYMNVTYLKLSNKYAGKGERVKKEVLNKLNCPFAREKMLDSLYQELDDEVISNIIFLYGLAESNSVAESVLRDYIKNSWVKEKHKELALLALRDIGAKEPYEIIIDNWVEELTLREYFERLRKSDWQPEWHKVLDCVLNKIKYNSNYNSDNSKILQRDLEQIWSKYLNRVYPLVPPIESIELWAAALEYLAFLKREDQINYKEIALRYAISPADLLEKSIIISNVKFR